MTIKRINEIKKVANSKFPHKCSMNEESLNFSNTLIVSPLLLTNNKKAELTKGSSFGSSAILLLFKTRRFPPPSHEGFGFIGRVYVYIFKISLYITLVNDLCTFLKMTNRY
jgi:hypothetical protein